MHGLLQAYSRTNRILNSIKTFGNIVCFRNLETATNESLALFGDKEAAGIVLLKTFDEYYNGYTQNDREIRGYAELSRRITGEIPRRRTDRRRAEQKELRAVVRCDSETTEYPIDIR